MVRITAKQYQEALARRRGGQPYAAAAAPKKKASRKPAVDPGPPSTPEPLALEPLLAGLSGVRYVKTMLMPYAAEMLTSNQRLHHMAEYKIKKQLRAARLKVGAAERN
ncbi:hypothetical protein [Streptomyces sp. HC307]|uniref:hypothetical protein n=1 Tax=Streptomyces flavusporus TaxID=3385496 RepID=UPI00391723ED